MTPKELGLKLRKLFPKLRDSILPDAQLALEFVRLEPAYEDLLSPTHRRLNEIAQRNFESGAFFESTRLKNVGQMISNARSEVMMLHEIDMVALASEHGVPVGALVEMAHETHRTNEVIRLNYENTKIGLDAGNRQLLTSHEVIDELDTKLMKLVARHDAETHPVKKRALAIRIEHLMEELDARGLQEVVQITGEKRLEREQSDANGGGSSQSETETSVEPVSVKGFGSSI